MAITPVIKASAARYSPAKGSTSKTAIISSYFRRIPIMPPTNAVTSAAIRTGADVKKPPIVVKTPPIKLKAPENIVPIELSMGPNLARLEIIIGR